MPIRVTCACGKVQVYPESYEGRSLPCRKCGALRPVTGEKFRPPLPPWYRRYLLPIILGITIPAIAIAAVLYSQRPRFTSAADEYEEGSKAPIHPEEDRRRIEELLARLADAEKEGNPTAFVRCFHLRRMLAEIERRGGIAAIGFRRDELEAVDQLEMALRKDCVQQKSDGCAAQSVKRCSIRFLDARGEAEAMVIFRILNAETRMRFWLIKENDLWSIFDFESLDAGIRLSTSKARLLAKAATGDPSAYSMRRASDLMSGAGSLMAQNKFEEALDALKEARPIAQAGFVPTIELLQAICLVRLQRLDEALKAADQCLVHRRDMPRAHQFRGIILAALEQHEESIKAYEDYLRIVGDDAQTWYAIGTSQEALGRIDRAKEAYRKGADCDPDDSSNRDRLKKLQESPK